VSAFTIGNVTFTPTATDSFTPNANPLNASFWTTFSGLSNLQALSGKCIATSDVACGEYYSGASFPANQFVMVTLSNWIVGNGQDLLLPIRSTTDFENNYVLDIGDNAGGGTAEIILTLLSGGGQGTILYDNESAIVAAGDTFIIAAVGTQISAYHNNTLLAAANDSTFSSGHLGVYLGPVVGTTDVEVQSFMAGTVAGLVPAGGNPVGPQSFKFPYAF
jgi:hypothetical protein